MFRLREVLALYSGWMGSHVKVHVQFSSDGAHMEISIGSSKEVLPVQDMSPNTARVLGSLNGLYAGQALKVLAESMSLGDFTWRNR